MSENQTRELISHLGNTVEKRVFQPVSTEPGQAKGVRSICMTDMAKPGGTQHNKQMKNIKHFGQLPKSRYFYVSCSG